MPIWKFGKKGKKKSGTEEGTAAAAAGSSRRVRTKSVKTDGLPYAAQGTGASAMSDRGVDMKKLAASGSSVTRKETKKERKAREKREKKLKKAEEKRKKKGLKPKAAATSAKPSATSSVAASSDSTAAQSAVKKGRFIVTSSDGVDSDTIDSAANSGGAKVHGSAMRSAAPKPSRGAGHARVLIEVVLPTSDMKDAGTYTEADILDIELPLIRTVVDADKKKQIVKRKLRMCCVSFNFENPEPRTRLGIERKRQMLVEVIEYISSNSWWDPSMLSELLTCMRYNLFRPLPTGAGKMKRVKGDEEEEPFQDPQWPHLELSYELCLRFLISGEIDKVNMQSQLSGSFLKSLIKLFESEDMRERDYLKTILHRIYGRFMPLREGIKRDIANEFFEYAYGVSRSPNGIAEFLDIFSSIINGFTVPVKTGHRDFLRTVLMPLHKCKRFDMYFQQLADCCVLFVNKEPKSAKIIVHGLIKFWPVLSPTKQALYLRELVSVLGALVEHPHGFSYGDYEGICTLGIDKMLEALTSDHFQVVDTALTLWKDSVMVAISDQDKRRVYTALCRLLNQCLLHWNEGIRFTADDIMNYYHAHDSDYWNEICAEYPIVLLEADDKAPDDAGDRRVIRLPKTTPLILGKEEATKSTDTCRKSERRRKWDLLRKMVGVSECKTAE